MFQGSLKDVKLPDIIQLMSVSSKTGCFVLEKKDEKGFIYLAEGQFVHAQCGKLTGEEAIYALSIWTEGSFIFDEGKTTTERSIKKRNTHIMMELARKFDEWRVLSKKIPSLDLIPELESLGNKKVSFNTQEWNVLAKINGIQSITQIADLTKMLPIDVAKLIYGLVASDLVHLRQEPKAAPDPNPLTAKPKHKASGKRTPEEEQEWLLAKIEKIYRQAKQTMSELAHPVIQRHCAKGVKEVNQGKSIAAVIETGTQIVKAAQLLEEDGVAKTLAAELRRIIKEP